MLFFILFAPMHILLLGSGGREHAFAWRLRQSPLCEQLFIAPGNAGTASCGHNVAISPNDFPALKALVLQEQISLVICGPEEPLVNGVQDYFRQDPALQAVQFLGPSQAAAQLEGSKAYAKAFMEDFGIPTAAYRKFDADQLEEALAYLGGLVPPIVLKADGLAAGKGVVILEDVASAQAEMRAMLEGKFGEASASVVVEEFLTGIEFSVFVLTDGQQYKILPVAKDYKRIGEGDTGLNTGGMGSISHPPFVDAPLLDRVEREIVQPTIRGLQARQLDYKGFVFIGLISEGGVPKVIEYNCRMGDPETQSVLMRLENDFVQLCLATLNGDLDEVTLQTTEQQAATVVLVAGGYPAAYEKGKRIEGIENVEGSMVFHAGTRLGEAGELLTAGGRVLAVTSLAPTFEEAVAKSLANADKIHFEGMQYRRDIGFDL